MALLSVFCDEAGQQDMSAGNYLLTLVLHDQSFDVSEAISSFDRDIASLGIVNLCFHAAPIIRGNGIFEILSEELRRKIFSRMMGFVRKVDFKYHCLCVDKRYCDTEEKMKEKLERQMHECILGVSSVIDGFSRVKVYYDCGQTYITHLLHKGFGELKIPIVEFAQSVKPRHYKLFQVADLICTLRLCTESFAPHCQTQTLIVALNSPRHGRQFLSQWLIIPSPWLKNPLIVVHNSPLCGSKIPSPWLKNPPPGIRRVRESTEVSLSRRGHIGEAARCPFS